MDCTTYRTLFKKYDCSLQDQDSETDAYDAWLDHTSDCNDCIEWIQGQRVKERGYKVSDYPCVHIAEAVTFSCHRHDDPWDCSDYIIVYFKEENRYGFPLRDVGNSYITFINCPWCGVKLDEDQEFSRRIPQASLAELD